MVIAFGVATYAFARAPPKIIETCYFQASQFCPELAMARTMSKL